MSLQRMKRRRNINIILGLVQVIFGFATILAGLFMPLETRLLVWFIPLLVLMCIWGLEKFLDAYRENKIC